MGDAGIDVVRFDDGTSAAGTDIGDTADVAGVGAVDVAGWTTIGGTENTPSVPGLCTCGNGVGVGGARYTNGFRVATACAIAGVGVGATGFLLRSAKLTTLPMTDGFVFAISRANCELGVI
jgi:hypothetical protein